MHADAGAELWNATDGLCGRMDGSPETDLSRNGVAGFADRWLANGPNDVCESPITDVLNASGAVVRRAAAFCAALKAGQFNVCNGKRLDTRAYVEACKMDYVKCVAINGTDCGCGTVSAYADECFGKDETISWRNGNQCR